MDPQPLGEVYGISLGTPALTASGDRRWVALPHSGIVSLADASAPVALGWPFGQQQVVYSAIAGEIATAVYQTNTIVAPSVQVVLISLEGEMPVEVGRVEVRGSVVTAVESRGDVLYVVSQDDAAATAWISSIDRSDPAAPELVAELELPYARNDRQRWRVIVAFAGDRFYVARPSGVVPETETSVTTRLQVVDASEPTGAIALRVGEVTIAGAVLSPKQIDGVGGSVRVVTSPLRDMINTTPPRLHVLADDGVMLSQTATLTIPLEENEYLMGSTTAHGVAYVSTGNAAGSRIHIIKLATTPLAVYGTIDLGSLNGHSAYLIGLEDRVLVQHGRPELPGSTRLALYALDGSVPELVAEHENNGSFDPFLGYIETHGLAYGMRNSTPLGECSYEPTLSFVRVREDGLDDIGEITIRGYQRFIGSLDGELLLEAGGRLGVASADSPSEVAWTPLAYVTQGIAISGDDVARVSSGEWSTSFLFDAGKLADAAQLPGTTLELDVGSGTTSCGRYMPYFWRTGDHAFVLHNAQSATTSDTITTLLSVDVSDPSEPVIDDTISYPNTRGTAAGNEYVLGATPNALVFRIVMYANNNSSLRHILEWLDVSDPQDVQLRSLELPGGVLGAGNAAPHAMLDGTMVATTLNDESGAIILERIDLADPAEPRMLEPVTVHGHVMGFGADSQHALLQRVAADPCSSGAWDLALVDLERAEPCVRSVVPGRGHLIANHKIVAGLVAAENKLVLGTWDGGSIELSEVQLPSGVYEMPTLAGYNVLLHGAATRIYDARCPDVPPATVSDVIVARDGVSPDLVLLVRQGTALMPAPRPQCD